MRNTRVKITWYAAIALTVLAAFSIYKGFEGVATTCAAGILTVAMGYQGSRAVTKSAAMKHNKTNENIEP